MFTLAPAFVSIILYSLMSLFSTVLYSILLISINVLLKEREEDKRLLNLKEVIRAHKTAYYSTAHNTLIRHETMSQSFSIFKYCAMIAPIFGIIIIIVIICFCVKMKGLGHMVSLISIPKASIALPIEKLNEDWKEEFDMSVYVIIVITLVSLFDSSILQIL